MEGKSILVHYDGKVFVPDEPVDLPTDQPIRLWMEPPTQAPSSDVDVSDPEESPQMQKLNEEMRQYYLNGGEDDEDREWAEASSRWAAEIWREMDDD